MMIALPSGRVSTLQDGDAVERYEVLGQSDEIGDSRRVPATERHGVDVVRPFAYRTVISNARLVAAPILGKVASSGRTTVVIARSDHSDCFPSIDIPARPNW
jgi:hypothetical protein